MALIAGHQVGFQQNALQHSLCSYQVWVRKSWFVVTLGPLNFDFLAHLCQAFFPRFGDLCFNLGISPYAFRHRLILE